MLSLLTSSIGLSTSGKPILHVDNCFEALPCPALPCPAASALPHLPCLSYAPAALPCLLALPNTHPQIPCKPSWPSSLVYSPGAHPFPSPPVLPYFKCSQLWSLMCALTNCLTTAPEMQSVNVILKACPPPLLEESTIKHSEVFGCVV